MQFIHVGSKQYAEKESQKKYSDFTNPVSLLAYGLRHELSRPARLRSLLLQDVAVPLLVASPQQHAFMDHDLHYVLSYCFLQDYPYKYEEKSDFLRRLAKFQKVIQQGIPAVTVFLSQFLPFWNEKDFFSEILNLVEWICVEPIEHVLCIVNTLARIFVRAQPMEQLAILRTFTNLYDNLARTSVKKKQYFLNTEVSKTQAEVVYNLSKCINNVCDAALQINPGDLRILWAATDALQCKGRSALRHRALAIDLHPTVCVLALVTPSAVLLEKLAELLLIHWKVVNKQSAHSEDLLALLQACTVDMMNCLWEGRALSKRADGVAFIRMVQNHVDVFIEKLNADQIFSLSSHLGLAPYTYVQFQSINLKDVDRKLLLQMAVSSNFPSLSGLIGKIVDVEQ
ncbi:hypothetical protein EVAR_41014_1 [Eumeta japonica]|uniref:Uncharacterized protein n=1 Tax=Eumeta variegata TaxID=151549 RepID=A0A4C1YY37_EUMVA|nr:hypothetical protein EVAR_41014_1 [Eumeta japonica]